MKTLAILLTSAAVLCSVSFAQETSRDDKAKPRAARPRGGGGESSNAQSALRGKLGELVEAGKLTREEAVQLLRPDTDLREQLGKLIKAGKLTRQEAGQLLRPDTDYGYSGRNKIADPAEHIKSQAKPIYSGPQPGEKLLSFKAVGLRGELEGKDFDPISRAGNKPHILLFTKGATGGRISPLLGYQLGAIMKGSKQDVHMTVVHLSDDPTEVTKYMGILAGRIAEFVDIGLSKDGADGPGNYGLDRNMTHTFLIAKDGTVVHNLPFPQQVFYNEPHILGAIADVMGVDHETLGKWLDSGAVGRGRRGTQGRGNGRGADRSSRTRERAPIREEIIKRFDKDGDGKLSEEEGQAARKARGR